MKKTLTHFLTLAIVAFSLAAASCSDSTSPADAESILATVPADAPVVAVFDLTKVASQSGGKISDNKMEKGEDLKKALALSGVSDKALTVLDGDAGIEMSAAVVFRSGAATYLSMLLEDAEKMREFVITEERKTNPSAEWKKEGDVYIYDMYAQKGEQLWICDRRPDAAAIAEMAALTKARSFVSCEYAATLAACDHAAQWYSPVSGLLDAAGLSFGDRTTAMMLSSMLFDNAYAIAGHADMDGKELKVTAEILDNTMKPARCNLKLGDIDVAQVAALGGNANTVLAIDMPHALVEQILKAASSFGGTLPKLYENILTPIDGTIAVASPDVKWSGAEAESGVFNASVTTSGNQATLMEALYGMGLTPKTEGNTLRFSRGNYGNGAFSLADASKKMQGASMALVARVNGRTPCDITATVKKHKSGLLLDLILTPAGDSPYFLVNIMPRKR